MAHVDEALVLPIEQQALASAGPVWARPLVVASDVLDQLTEVAYVTATAVFAAIMLVGVFFRYVLNDSLSWSDELALIVFAWATFLSIATAYRHDKHVNVGMLVERFPPDWQARLGVVAEGLAGGYLVSLLASGIQALEIASRAHTDALQWPLTVPYLSIPVASALMLVHWLRRNLAERPLSGAPTKFAIALAFFAVVFLPFGLYLQLSGPPRFFVLVLALFFPMLIGVPVAFCLGLMGTTYVAVFGNIPFNTGALQIFFGIEVLTLMAIPLLILSGSVMHSCGVAERMVSFAQALVGRVRGGLGPSNVIASFLFGDISGSAVSDTAAIGSLMIPEMKRRGYRADFCAALQGASGTLGMMAPLSITVLLYASAINVSVSRLASATIVPAILVASSFMLVALVHARRYNYPIEHVSRSVLLPRALAAAPGLFAGVLVIGGIVGGVFTPAEVGVVLLAYVLLMAIFLYRTAEPRRLYRTTVEAGYISGMTLFMAATSAFLGFVLARDLVSATLVETVAQISLNKYFVLFLVSLAFVVLGMVLEAPAMIYAFLPSFMPLLLQAGVDPVHWGVLFVINMGLGMLVPPVALNLFISTQIAGVRYDQAVRAAIPFMVIMVVDMVLVAVFPHIPLLLPNLIFGHPIR
ncbi:MAG: TRAP transporter large permease subunit [Chloroflexi bacterium]|nr:TRAP transporter large permease subunit [Chloroflexota bacterium]